MAGNINKKAFFWSGQKLVEVFFNTVQNSCKRVENNSAQCLSVLEAMEPFEHFCLCKIPIHFGNCFPICSSTNKKGQLMY